MLKGKIPDGTVVRGRIGDYVYYGVLRIPFHTNSLSVPVFVVNNGGWRASWFERRHASVVRGKYPPMKMLGGIVRYDGFRFYVACAQSLGVPDTIVAGCRRWASFREAREWYNTRRYDEDPRKRAESLRILAELKVMYDREKAREDALIAKGVLAPRKRSNV